MRPVDLAAGRAQKTSAAVVVPDDAEDDRPACCDTLSGIGRMRMDRPSLSPRPSPSAIACRPGRTSLFSPFCGSAPRPLSFRLRLANSLCLLDASNPVSARPSAGGRWRPTASSPGMARSARLHCTFSGESTAVRDAEHRRAAWPSLGGLRTPRYEPRRHADAGHGRLSKRTPRSSHMFLCSHDVSEFMLHA